MFSDPYEEWKQGGRKGPAPGSQPAPAPAPAPGPAPLTTPPAPAPRPAPQGAAPGGQDLSGFKTYGDWQNANRAAGGSGQSNEIQSWYNSKVNPSPQPQQPWNGQGAPPPSTVQLGNGQTVDQLFAGQRAGDATGADAYRDTEQYDQNQWGAWEQSERERVANGQSANQTVNKYNPDGKGCPPDKPFTSRPGPDGKSECAAKPDDCPDGSHVVGTPGKCMPGTGGGGGGGNGGAGGAGGSGGGMSMQASSTPGGGDMQSWWANMIQQQGTRYSPEAMAALEADQFSRARAQEKLQLQQSRQDQAQRGVARSQNQAAATRQIGVGTGQQIMANRAQIQRQKVDADYQDKQAAIKNAMDYVNSMRDYMLRMEGNSIQREQMAAQIRLATMNINAQKDMLEQQYQNNLSTGFLLG